MFQDRISNENLKLENEINKIRNETKEIQEKCEEIEYDLQGYLSFLLQVERFLEFDQGWDEVEVGIKQKRF